MLVRYDPFRQLDRISGDLLRQPPRPAPPLDAHGRGRTRQRRASSASTSRVSSPDSVDVTVERQVLTVKRRALAGPRPRVTRSSPASVPHGSVSRQVTLAETLDTDHLEAHFDGGVLTVTIPVAEQAKARKVEIHTGAPELDAVDA